MQLVFTLACLSTVFAATNMRQQQFKVCTVDTDCNAGFFCLPTYDGTFAMCQPGARSPARNFVCTDHADYWGDDLYNSHTGYAGCAYDCRTNPNCNAFAWVQDAAGQQGMCYFKHLQDINRAPTTNNANMKACKDTPATTSTPSTVQWVTDPGYQLMGDRIGNDLSNIESLAACQAACQKTAGCAAVSYMKYYKQCTLQKAANNYYPVWSKAVDLGAAASMQHNYKTCYGNYDVPYQGDVSNFQGSFQDCAKCMEGGKANAFAWYLGPIGDMARPLNPQGTCYCKKLTSPVPPPPAGPGVNGGTILCVA
ncbi:hypothetical protein ACHHYP_05897 [Achlya hypogyna]|uniref:Secreted protein n=1 Tax=Achlya hypogyna TaxID=1202772 RepID=A0A0A7CN98_ACHHY|nr:secreted protein [Achlya hypogyna]OQR89980.1 hypothetical protein ACHHYP_05897 [Achlya hypogyna]